MTGVELIEWRNKNGYTQHQLQKELGVKSRGTISSWENSDKPLSRIVELALIALERLPELRNFEGKAETFKGRAEFEKRFGKTISAK